jgi:D-alanyl-D-alanine carboxypeptidase
MNHAVPPMPSRSRTRAAGLMFALLSLLTCAAASAASASAVLPDTPVGALGRQLMTHVKADTPEQIRQWAPTILSPAIGEAERATFVNGLVSAVRDSGGVDLIDVREQQGFLVLTVKARRNGQLALFVLAPDEAEAGKLKMADVVAMDDPALYAEWPKAAVPREALTRLIRTALDGLVRTADFSGCVTVSDGASTIFDECRGLAQRGFDVPIDRQTRFHIGSMNKMFTAVAIAQLVEAGKLSWHATLAEHVPEYPDRAAAEKITVWQLLHHTAGLGDFLVPEYFAHRERFVDPVDYLDLIARQPRVSAPGEGWSYSNAGYLLLGRIVEKVSGERYADYIQRHVFAPARMTASGYDRLDDVVPKLAVGYYREGVFSGEWKADWMKTAYQAGPAGGGYSNNADLLRFAHALRAGKLVKPATLTKMFDDAVPAGGPGSYAAGFGVRLSHGRQIRGHSGGIEGTTANLAIVWETGAAIALTSNQGPSQHWLLAERIADLLAAEGAKTE